MSAKYLLRHSVSGAAEKKPHIHKLNIQNPPDCPVYDFIANGTKTVEGRAYDGKYKKYKIGDHILFHCDDRPDMEVRITELTHYESLEAYLLGEGVRECLPCVTLLQDAVAIYHRWYSAEHLAELKKKQQYVFLAIHIRKVN